MTAPVGDQANDNSGEGQEPEPEFSRIILKGPVGDAPKSYVFDATEEECSALAARFELLSLSDFSVSISLQPKAGGTVVRLEGLVRAKAEQACVVTLEPVLEQVEEPFSLTLSSRAAKSMSNGDGEVDLSMDEEDPPEPLTEAGLDIGALAAEHLSLGLDPFPRKPGASFENPAEEDEEKPESPFAVLAQLRPKEKKSDEDG